MAISRKTRTISLTAEQDNYVEQLVDGGQYQNASEVVREALRTHATKLEQQQAALDEIRARIGKSMESVKNGDSVVGTPEEVIGAVFEEALKNRGL